MTSSGLTPKNILIALPNDILGGAEQFLKLIAVQYALKGYSVKVFFITHKKTNSWEDTKHILQLYYGTGNSERKGAFPFILRLLRFRKIEYEISFTSHIHLTGIIGFLKKTNLLHINHLIGRESTSIFKRFTGLRLIMLRFFYFIGYSSVDLLICQTEYMKQQLLAGIPKISRKIKRIIVLANPIDLPESVIKSSENITSLFLDPRFKYIISAGRLIPEKGFDILIKAFYLIAQKNKKLRLIILGEGILRKDLERLIKELFLTDKVLLPGYVHNVYPYFKIASLCVISSRVEGFPNVLLQMMSQNGNVVSTLCAGEIEEIPELTICHPDDVGSLKTKMVENLQTNDATIKHKLNVYKNYLIGRSAQSFIQQIESYIYV